MRKAIGIGASVLVVLTLGGLISAVIFGGGAADSSNVLFADRVDRHPNDQERRLGDPVTIGSVRAAVESSEFRDELCGFDDTALPDDLKCNLDAGYLILTVVIKNLSEEPVSFSAVDWYLMWRLKDEAGERMLLEIVDDWEDVKLLPGQTLRPTLPFEVGSAKGGMFYAEWMPGRFEPFLWFGTRGVWEVHG